MIPAAPALVMAYLLGAPVAEVAHRGSPLTARAKQAATTREQRVDEVLRDAVERGVMEASDVKAQRREMLRLMGALDTMVDEVARATDPDDLRARLEVAVFSDEYAAFIFEFGGLVQLFGGPSPDPGPTLEELGETCPAVLRAFDLAVSATRIGRLFRVAHEDEPEPDAGDMEFIDPRDMHALIHGDWAHPEIRKRWLDGSIAPIALATLAAHGEQLHPRAIQDLANIAVEGFERKLEIFLGHARLVGMDLPEDPMLRGIEPLDLDALDREWAETLNKQRRWAADFIARTPPVVPSDA